MEVRHYASSNGRPVLRRNPDAELDAYLAAREGHPTQMSESALCRGIPAVQTREVRYSERWKSSVHKRQPVTDGKGNEITVSTRRRTTRRTVPVLTRRDTDVALQLKMGTIHEQDV